MPAVLIAILAVAAVLRFADLPAARLNIDHAYPVAQALDTLDHGALPLIGQPTSVFAANPPLTGYLFVPVLALTRSVLAVYVFVVLLNTAAVYFCYRATAVLLDNPWLGLAAAWLMAVNPWMIEFSRTTWVQCLLPFQTTVILWLLIPVLRGRAARPVLRLGAALIALTLSSLTFLLTFFLALPVALLLVIFRRHVPKRGLLIGGAVLVAATGAFVLALLANPEAGFARIGNFASEPARVKPEAALHAIRLVTGDQYGVSRAPDLPDAAAWQSAEASAHFALQIVLGVGIAAAIGALRRPGGRRPAAIVALVWFALPVAAMSYNGSPVHPHYLLLSLPAGFALAAWGAGVVARPPLARVLVVGGLAAAGLVSAGSSVRLAQETRLGLNAGLDSIPLYDGERIGAAINAAVPDGGLVYANTLPWILSSFAGRSLNVVNEVRMAGVTIIPVSGGLVVTLSAEPIDPPPLASDSQVIPITGGMASISRFVPGGIDLDALPNAMNVPTAQGLSLRGYDLTSNRRGTRWTLTTYWHVVMANPDASRDAFGSFTHVYDADGAQILNVDGHIVPGYLWNTGDLHVHQQRFELAPDIPFTVGIGQYDADAGQNLAFILPTGEWVVEVVITPE
ncbi:MAG: hypothetical protein IPM16_14305 [Chloroflexi bacterium]|nr:hypothetical protein [Chloroflexota bacterium]